MFFLFLLRERSFEGRPIPPPDVRSGDKTKVTTPDAFADTSLVNFPPDDVLTIEEEKLPIPPGMGEMPQTRAQFQPALDKFNHAVDQWVETFNIHPVEWRKPSKSYNPGDLIEQAMRGPIPILYERVKDLAEALKPGIKSINPDALQACIGAVKEKLEFLEHAIQVPSSTTESAKKELSQEVVRAVAELLEEANTALGIPAEKISDESARVSPYKQRQAA